MQHDQISFMLAITVFHKFLVLYGDKSLIAITQDSYEQYWTNPGGSTQQSSSCTTTYHPSQKTIQDIRTRHARPCWRSEDEFISDIPLGTPSHRRAKAGRPTRTYIQLCTNTGWSRKVLPGAMDDRDGWRERFRVIRAGSETWWWRRRLKDFSLYNFLLI